MSGLVLKELPFTVDAFCYARNGAIPDARFFNRVANAQNNILAYRTKQVFNVWNPGGGSGSTGVSRVMHRWRFHSGYGARFVKTMLCVGPGAHPTNDAIATISIDVAGAGTPSTVSINGGQTQGVADSPDRFQWVTRTFAISANTTYEMSITIDNEMRLLGVSSFTLGYDEVDGSVDFYVEGGSTYGVINETNRQRFTEGLSKIWKRNGAHLFNWSCDVTAKTTTGATWTNPIDATTAIASTSAGVILGDDLLGPYGRRVQPTYATMCVYGQVTGGAGTGEVRLFSDYGGASPTLCSVTGIAGTLGWYSTNQILGAGNFASDEYSKVDLQHRMNGAGTFNLYAVSLYLYQT